MKIVYSMENALQDADLIIKGMRKYRRSLKEQAAFVIANGKRVVEKRKPVCIKKRVDRRKYDTCRVSVF